jgi:xylulokinase
MIGLIGLDIGTTGCKTLLFSADGELIASRSFEYAVDISQPLWAEQDAEHVWQLAQQAIREVVRKSGTLEIKALSLSVQGEAVIPIDALGNALRPAILGMDTRTAEQNRWLTERISARALFEKTGMPVHTINTLPKLIWIAQHEPEIWNKANRFLLYEDFIINKMTGEPVISRCLASRTQLFDLNAGTWSAEILDLIGLKPDRLARVQDSGRPVAPMRRDLAESLGFREPPLVVNGGHDQACGALGVGVMEPGLAMVSSGTAEVVEVGLAQPSLSDPLYKGNLSCYAHVVPEMYLAMTLNHSGGLLLRWFRDEFGQLECQQAAAEGKDAYDLLFASGSGEPSGMLVLPHFSGSGTPFFDTESKGAIVGLTFGKKKADIAKAILEGLTFELRQNLEILRDGGVQIQELRAIGGGAKSNAWLKLKATITGIPVLVPRIIEAAGWGAAILAGTGAGVYPSAAAQAKQALHIERKVDPDLELKARYDEIYNGYKALYPALREISRGLS